jgi:hypothetical protein
MLMSMMMTQASGAATPLTDPRLAAVALAIGGTLVDVQQEPGRDRVTFMFEGLSTTFLSDVINGRLNVVARDFISGLEHVTALLAQIRANRVRR